MSHSHILGYAKQPRTSCKASTIARVRCSFHRCFFLTPSTFARCHPLSRPVACRLSNAIMVEKKLEGIQLVIRLIALVSGIIVLAIIVDKLKVDVTVFGISRSVCVYQGVAGGTETCDFGIAMGAISLVVGLVLSIVNVLALVLPAPLALVVLPGGRRGKLALLDLVVSVLIGVVWFACAVYTTVEYADVMGTADEPNAGLFFTWLSFALWIGAGVVAIVIYKKSDTILPGDN